MRCYKCNRVRTPINIVASLLYVATLAACHTAVVDDINSPFYKIRRDSVLILHEELDIPAGQAHVKFQHGKIVGGVDSYTVNCRFNVRPLGPVTVAPGRFLVSRAESPMEWVSQPGIMRFYRVIYLTSEQQPDVMNLTCQYWSSPLDGRDVTVAQMKEALGKYFSFEFRQSSQ